MGALWRWQVSQRLCLFGLRLLDVQSMRAKMHEAARPQANTAERVGGPAMTRCPRCNRLSVQYEPHWRTYACLWRDCGWRQDIERREYDESLREYFAEQEAEREQ